MYNHNKAQQSKNRGHISWDILYSLGWDLYQVQIVYDECLSILFWNRRCFNKIICLLFSLIIWSAHPIQKLHSMKYYTYHGNSFILNVSCALIFDCIKRIVDISAVGRNLFTAERYFPIWNSLLLNGRSANYAYNVRLKNNLRLLIFHLTVTVNYVICVAPRVL